MNLPQASRSIEHFLHAYAQAPWRAQRQWVGALLLLVLALGMTAALYLDVTSQAAIAGRQIQSIRLELSLVQQANADLKSQAAELTSTASMEDRARLLEYEPVEASELQYVSVPGYVIPEPSILTGASALRPSAASMPPEYTESLVSWLGRRLEYTFFPVTGGSR
jgi:hypothetical protein